MKQAHVFISGFVQGVGYRVFVKKTAKKLGLAGWVRNLPDRRVEALVQGEEAQILKLIKKCQSGSFFAEVKNITIDWQDIDELKKDFQVTRD